MLLPAWYTKPYGSFITSYRSLVFLGTSCRSVWCISCIFDYRFCIPIVLLLIPGRTGQHNDWPITRSFHLTGSILFIHVLALTFSFGLFVFLSFALSPVRVVATHLFVLWFCFCGVLYCYFCAGVAAHTISLFRGRSAPLPEVPKWRALCRCLSTVYVCQHKYSMLRRMRGRLI